MMSVAWCCELHNVKVIMYDKVVWPVWYGMVWRGSIKGSSKFFRVSYLLIPPSQQPSKDPIMKI